MSVYGYSLVTSMMASDPFRKAIHTIALLVTLVGGGATRDPPAAIARDYCQSEYFNVTCHHNEVILMEHAQYGRMRSGRCVTGNYGNVGCAVDVLPYLDSKCSGQQNCKVYIADPVLHKMEPCPKDLTSYLEAKFTCTAVSQGSVAECRRNRVLKVTGNTGYLSSFETSLHGYGTAECPWEIRAEKGQTIRFSLLRFGPGRIEDDALTNHFRQGDVCYELATIIDGPDRKIVTTCGGNDREKTLVISRSNKVVVEFLPQEVLKGLSPFFIKYQALGCAALVAPRGGTVKVVDGGQTAEVRCNNSEATWRLVCSGTAWIGELGNCTHATQTWSLGNILKNEEKFPFGILIVVAIGVALGVFFGGILLSVAAVYMKRKNRPYDNPEVLRREIDDPYQEHKGFTEEHMATLNRDGHYRVTYAEEGQYCPRHDSMLKDSGYASHTIPSYNGTASTKSGHVYESPQFS